MSGKPNEKMFETMVKKHGSEEAARNWFRTIGGRGGKIGKTGGFAADVDCSCDIFPYKHFVKNCAGKKGGRSSTRKGIKNVR